MGLCPPLSRATATELCDRASAPEAALGQSRTAQQMVTTALNGLGKKSSLIVDSLKNSLLSLGPRLIRFPMRRKGRQAQNEVSRPPLKKSRVAPAQQGLVALCTYRRSTNASVWKSPRQRWLLNGNVLEKCMMVFSRFMRFKVCPIFDII